MKNSTLIIRLIIAIVSIWFVFTYPVIVALGILIFIALFIFFYVLYCAMEHDMDPENYGNKKYEYVFIPKKYNFITIFINWINSFPPIIKKKNDNTK